MRNQKDFSNQIIIDKAKKSTLDWFGKKAVVNHHREVPFRLLKSGLELSVGDPESDN